MKQLLLSERESIAVTKALELYIRLGLGQLSEIGTVLEELTELRTIDHDDIEEIKYHLIESDGLLRRGDEWLLQDAATHSLTVAAFGVQAKLGENWAAWEWACRELHGKGDLD